MLLATAALQVVLDERRVLLTDVVDGLHGVAVAVRAADEAGVHARELGGPVVELLLLGGAGVDVDGPAGEAGGVELVPGTVPEA